MPVAKKVTEEAVTETVEKKKPVKRSTTRRKKQIDLDQEILCKNLTSSELKYISKKNGMEIVWSTYGDEQYVDATELVAMKASQPKFLNEPWIYVDDPDLVQHLGLSALYKKLDDSVDIDNLFKKSATQVKKIVSGLPRSMREVVADKAREGIKNETLNNLQVIRTLEKELNTKLED